MFPLSIGVEEALAPLPRLRGGERGAPLHRRGRRPCHAGGHRRGGACAELRAWLYELRPGHVRMYIALYSYIIMGYMYMYAYRDAHTPRISMIQPVCETITLVCETRV